jgi:nucleoside-diphosphate-sugar epimerase
MEGEPKSRGDAYTYAKVRQDELLIDYVRKYNIPFVIVRPGVVFGPGNRGMHTRVGIGTFGIFLYLGGSNRIPLTYVDNCADAIALAGIKKGVDGEIFNIVDDDIPTARVFLKTYKKHVGNFRSLYVPYGIFYLFSYLWEKYSAWSRGQLPPAFNRRACETYLKGNCYSNEKLKKMLGWKPTVSMEEGLARYFRSEREAKAIND